ncbi:MAG: BON domain-containing protein [Pseudomonadota bacterium]
MSLISFGRDAGIDLPAQPAAEGGTPPAPLCMAVQAHLAALGLQAHQLELSFDPQRAVMRVSGCAPDQDTRERIVLCCGNVRGVAAVDDRMTVLMPSEVSRWRFVQPGDTLARIATDLYRDERRAQHLRAANQPLIGEADELQPGWLLRVPA